MEPNPFANRRKSFSGETVGEVRAKLVRHRMEKHDTYSMDTFFDCAYCGMIERRLQNLMDLQGEAQHES